ncbi:hypothetical protein Tco_1227004 [Tanacetum coccineum]
MKCVWLPESIGTPTGKFNVIAGGLNGCSLYKVQYVLRVLNDLSAEEKERHLGNIVKIKINSGRFELTKDDRESQLYDEFEHFHQIKGETIQGYYVRGLKMSNLDQLYALLESNRGEGYQLDDDVDGLHREDWLLNVDHVFLKMDECDAFDSDVKEGYLSLDHVHGKISHLKILLSDEAGPYMTRILRLRSRS